MTNVQTFSSKQEIHQQACEWISRFDRGLTVDEDNAFSDWVNISYFHRKCLFEVAQTWDDLSVLNELSSLFPLADNQARKSKIWSNRNTTGIAASLAIVVSGMLWLVNSQLTSTVDDPLILALDAETSVGEQQSLNLTDGSVIHLNTNSVVSVDYSHLQRNIYLVRGEALFEVAHDEKRPFVVSAGDNTVTAVGTAFNVQLNNPEQFELLVTEGKVLVKSTAEAKAVDLANDLSHVLDGKGQIMIAGQKALIKQTTMQQVTLSKEQIQKDLAWQQGMLVFHGEPLAEALHEISRYTQVHFILADEQVKQRRVAGYFKAGDIQGLLFALENNFNIVYTKNDEQTIVLSSGIQSIL